MADDLPEIVDEPIEDESVDEVTDDDSSEEEGIDESEEELEEESEEPEEKEEKEEDEDDKKTQASPYHRPVFSEIKKEFPEFFKKFPEMREMYFREGQFSKLFPTIEDAEEAFNKSDSFDFVIGKLREGSIEELLENLAKIDAEAPTRIVDNFLPTLSRQSPDAYYAVVSPIIAGFIRNLYKQGETEGNESKKAAALYAAQFGWGHTDLDKLVPEKKPDPQVEAEKKRLFDERRNLESRQYREVHGAVSERASKLILNEIVKVVAPIKDSYKRNNAVKDIFAKVNEVLTSDPRHMKLMNSLWHKAKNSGYSTESRNRLVSTFLVRAKEVIPAISREIMTQVNPNMEKKQLKKKIVGKVKDENSSNSNPERPTGKVNWAKYNNDPVKFLQAVSEKGINKVERT